MWQSQPPLSRGLLVPQVLEGLQNEEQLPLQLRGRRGELQCCARMEVVVAALDAGRIADAQRHLAAAEQCLGVSSKITGKHGTSVHSTSDRISRWLAFCGSGTISPNTSRDRIQAGYS